jgi:hypothetical protein
LSMMTISTILPSITRKIDLENQANTEKYQPGSDLIPGCGDNQFALRISQRFGPRVWVEWICVMDQGTNSHSLEIYVWPGSDICIEFSLFSSYKTNTISMP